MSNSVSQQISAMGLLCANLCLWYQSKSWSSLITPGIRDTVQESSLGWCPLGIPSMGYIIIPNITYFYPFGPLSMLLSPSGWYFPSFSATYTIINYIIYVILTHYFYLIQCHLFNNTFKIKFKKSRHLWYYSTHDGCVKGTWEPTERAPNGYTCNKISNGKIV